MLFLLKLAVVAALSFGVAAIAAPSTGNGVDLLYASMVVMPAAREVGGYALVEFCHLFGISRSTLYAEWRAGRIRFAKVRGRSLVTASEARRYQELLDAEADAGSVGKAEARAP